MSNDFSFDQHHRDAVGSAAEEATRLVQALRRWVDERGAGFQPAVDDSAECKYCPICQVLHVVRQGQPEVSEHLSQAAASLIAAVQAGISAHEAHWSRPASPDVEHIDID